MAPGLPVKEDHHARPDFCAEAEAIAVALRGAGYHADADALRDAVRSGSTGTEILMALRWHLRQIGQGSSLLEGAVVARIRKLVADLDNALR
jgi:hypothetical protein